MKHLPYIYVLLLPYIFLVELYCILTIDSPLLTFILFSLLGVLGIAAVITCNVLSITKFRALGASVWSLLIKLAYLPFILCMCFLALGMLNPWLFLFSGAPIILVMVFTAISGIINIGACIRCRRDKKLSFLACVFFSFLSFLCIADIIVIIVQIYKASRK